MHKNLLLILILTIFLFISCNDNNTEPPDITSNDTTIPTPEQTTAEPEQDLIIQNNDMLSIIIDNMKSTLTNDKNEYDSFINVLNTIGTYLENSNDENLKDAVTSCANLYEELSSAPFPENSLNSDEIIYLSEYGVDTDVYNGFFDNFMFLRNVKIDALSGLSDYLSEAEESQETLKAIIPFYMEYNKLFQMDTYYAANSIINEITVEDETINDFRDVFYVNLIENLSDSMVWEYDNQVINAKTEQIYNDLSATIDDFVANSNLIEE